MSCIDNDFSQAESNQGDVLPPPRSPGPNVTARDLFKQLVPLIKSDVTELMEAAITGLGYVNPEAFG